MEPKTVREVAIIPILENPELILLRENLESKIDGNEKYIEKLHDELEKARAIALVENEKALTKLNELRGVLEDQNKTFTREIKNEKDHERFEAALQVLTELKSDKLTNTKDHDRYDSNINALNNYKSKMDGMATQESVNKISLRSQTGIILGILSFMMGVVALALEFFKLNPIK